MRGGNHTANVMDADVFQQLIDTTNGFVSDSEECVERIDEYVFIMDNEMHRIKDVLAQRLCDAETKLHNCDMALTLCQARPSYDSEGHPQAPDCSSEEHERMKAKRQFEVARNNMNKMEELMRIADHLVKQFEESKKSFKDLLEIRLQDGNDELRRKDRVVQEYMNSRINL